MSSGRATAWGMIVSAAKPRPAAGPPPPSPPTSGLDRITSTTNIVASAITTRFRTSASAGAPARWSGSSATWSVVMGREPVRAETRDSSTGGGRSRTVPGRTTPHTPWAPAPAGPEQPHPRAHLVAATRPHAGTEPDPPPHAGTVPDARPHTGAHAGA